MNNHELTTKCAFCDTEFIAKRTTAKFCSDSCRTMANNRRRECEKLLAIKAVEQAERDDLKRGESEARKLKKEIKAAAIAENQRMAELEHRIQMEKDAADLAENNRKEEQERQKLKEKEEADKRHRIEKIKLEILGKYQKGNKKNQSSFFDQIGQGFVWLGVGALLINALIKPKEESSMIKDPQNEE